MSTNDHARLTMETLDLLRLEAAERERLAEELLAMSRTGFTERDEASSGEPGLREHITRSVDVIVHDHYNTAFVLRAGEQPVSVLHVYACCLQVQQRRVVVSRLTMVTAPQYRQRQLMTRTTLRYAWHYLLRHPVSVTPHYLTGVVMTPQIYYMTARRLRHLFPRPGPPTDPALVAVYRTLYGEPRPRPTPYVTQEATETRRWLQSSTDPFIRHYLDINPNYAAGYGLPVVIRGNMRDVLHAVAQSLLVLPLARRLHDRKRD